MESNKKNLKLNYLGAQYDLLGWFPFDFLVTEGPSE